MMCVTQVVHFCATHFKSCWWSSLVSLISFIAVSIMGRKHIIKGITHLSKIAAHSCNHELSTLHPKNLRVSGQISQVNYLWSVSVRCKRDSRPSNRWWTEAAGYDLSLKDKIRHWLSATTYHPSIVNHLLSLDQRKTTHAATWTFSWSKNH